MLGKFLLSSIVTLSLLSGSVFAGEKENCVPFEFKTQNKNLVLSAVEKENKVFIFKNISSQSVWLDHPVEHPSASAGWSSFLRTNHASAMLVNRKSFTLSCSVITPGNVTDMDCAKVISVCVPGNTSKAAVHKGTYWLVEDKPWADVVSILQKKGISLKS